MLPLLQDNERFEVAEPEAAVGGGHVDAEKPHLRVLVQQLMRGRCAGALGFGCERQQPLAGILAGGGLQCELLISQPEVHVRSFGKAIRWLV